MQVEKTTKQVGNNCNPTPTKLPVLIYGEAKAVSSTNGTTMQVEKTKKQVGNNCNPTPTKLSVIIYGEAKAVSLPVIIYGEAKAVSSTKGSTMQVEKTKKQVGNNCNPPQPSYLSLFTVKPKQ
jgi:hypothetical protein